MADLIRIKGGLGEIPKLQVRELGYGKDVKALYIGTEDGNVRLCGVGDLEEINAKINSINTAIDEINTAIQNINARFPSE